MPCWVAKVRRKPQESPTAHASSDQVPVHLPADDRWRRFFLEMFKYYIVSESPNFVDERYYEIRGLKFGYCYLSSTCIQCSIAFSHETRIRSCHERVVNIYIHKCSWKNHNVHVYDTVSFHIKHYSKSSEIKYKYIVFIPIHNELKVKTNEKQCTCTSNWLCIWRYG